MVKFMLNLLIKFMSNSMAKMMAKFRTKLPNGQVDINIDDKKRCQS